MKRALSLFFTLLMSLPAVSSTGTSLEFQSKILYMRAREVLHYRMIELSECRDQSKVVFLSRNYDRYKARKFTSQNERLIHTLDLVSRSAQIQECAEAIKKADERITKLQKSKINIPLKAAKGMCLTLPPNQRRSCQTILNELDPFCATQNAPDYFGVKDPNPCMAGDRLLGKVLRKPQDPYQDSINFFLSALEEKINSSDRGEKIDLWNVYLELERDTPASRKQFVAMVTFFYYSLGTAGGYIDGIADHYWLSSLNEENKASDVFKEFFSLRSHADWYRSLIRGEKGKQRTFVISGMEVEGMNRHDFMSMFLSCHFKRYGRVVSRILPNLLGISYESLDFVSHIKEDVSVRRSIENFRTDTGRYKRGTTWASSFCPSN